MHAALDVDYRTTFANAAGVLFEDWTSAAPLQETTVQVAPLHAYVPGQFYMRELPCLLKVLETFPSTLDAIVIDGFVTLDEMPDGSTRRGLGMHLFEALGQKTPVVGVAKTPFKGAACESVLRPGSTRPLYVTATGMDRSIAAAAVRTMHGSHRLPTLLKWVDALARR